MDQPLGAGFEEPVNRNGAFPRLGEEQRARLRAVGTVRQVESGEVLFREGDAGYDFFLVESGAVTIVQGYGHENRIISVHGTHRFLGEVNLLTGSPPYLSAVVRDAGEVIQVSAERLRNLLANDEELSNIILRAFLARREILIDIGAGVKLVGSRYSQCTRRLREFLARNRMPFQWLDLEEDEEADGLLRALGISAGETPVVISGEGVLRNPSNAEVAKLLGFGSGGAAPPMCDLVIVGAGPAGLAAAVYGASEGLDTQVIDKIAFGRPGQHVGADRELPRVPDRDLGERARRARHASGEAVRRAHGRAGASRRPGGRRRPLHDRAVRRVGGQRPDADRRHRRPIPEARPPRARALRGPRHLLRRHPGGGADVRRGSGADRRRRQLRRPGRDVPLASRRELPPDDPWR